MKISCLKKLATESKKEAILIPVYKNMKPLRHVVGKSIDTELQTILESDYFNFDEKECRSFFLEINKKLKKIYVLHIPKEVDDPKIYMQLGSKIAKMCKNDKISSFSIVAFEDIYNIKKDYFVTKAFIAGFMYRAYNFDKFKNKKSAYSYSDFEIEVLTTSSKLKKFVDDSASEWLAFYENINILKDLVNTPANLLRPVDFAAFVKDNLPANVRLTAWNEEEIIANKLNLLHAVGRGSKNKPRFLHLEYKGDPDSEINIALVGKGITFDTGGTSLKPSSSMATMKCDMTGAALTFTLTKLIAEMQLKVNVNTYIPLAENIIGGDALVPGDVIVGHSEKSIEILNTDAEGRLILADALSLALKTDPEVVIDVATLTGACVVALGPYCAGLFSNRRFLSKQLSDISYETCEDVWELPLFADYEEGLKSSVADMQNMSTFAREGGAIHAALFLKQFVDNYPWIHLDIAGPAFIEKEHSIYGKEASGFGLRLLYRFIKEHYEKES